MSDIVERAEKHLKGRDGGGTADEILCAALDEIERLRAENATARQAADDVYSRLMPEVELLRAQVAALRKMVKNAYDDGFWQGCAKSIRPKAGHRGANIRALKKPAAD